MRKHVSRQTLFPCNKANKKKGHTGHASTSPTCVFSSLNIKKEEEEEISVVSHLILFCKGISPIATLLFHPSPGTNMFTLFFNHCVHTYSALYPRLSILTVWVPNKSGIIIIMVEKKQQNKKK